MRDVKRYCLLAFAVAFACLLKFPSFGRDLETVGNFRGANLLKEDWNPLIADTVNEKKLSLALDHREYTNQDTSIYMDDNLNIMVPADILSEGLKCSSHIYGKEELRIEKRNDAVRLTLGEAEISVNKKKHTIESPMTERKGRYYVSIADIF